MTTIYNFIEQSKNIHRIGIYACSQTVATPAVGDIYDDEVSLSTQGIVYNPLH